MKPTRTQVLVPLAILFVGVVLVVVIQQFSVKPARVDAVLKAVPVDVVTAVYKQQAARIPARGAVIPAQQVDLVPEVTGRVTSIAEGLAPGLRVQKGDLLARVDTRPYKWAVDQANSQVAQARLQYDMEVKRQAQAEREWELLGDSPNDQAPDLAVRRPHVTSAKAGLGAAEASLSKAKLDLYRTGLRAPFNAVVLSESLDVGQVVSMGAPVARLAGTDAVWIDIALPIHDVVLFDVPGYNADSGAPVRVFQPLVGGAPRDAVVHSMSGQLDPTTRTAKLLIEVDNPYDPPEGAAPLLPGSWVDVEILGRQAQRVVEVPREGIVDGQYVWVADPEDRLERKRIEVAWSTREDVYVSHGIDDGDRVVVSPLSLPVQGMPLTPRERVARDDTQRGTP